VTRTQRKVHVLMWAVVGTVAVVGLVLAVLWRPPVPVQPGRAPGAASQPIESMADTYTRSRLPGVPDE